MVIMGQSHKQSGNVLFLILIAVVLFAALSYAVTQSSRGGGDVDRETLRLKAQKFISFGDSVRLAVQRMTIVQRIDIEDLNFSENATGPTAVFHPDGGGATWMDPPQDSYDGSGAYNWNFYKPSNNWGVWGVGTDNSGTGGEAFIWLLNLDEGVCSAINDLMGHGFEIPNDPTSAALPNTISAYEGEWAFCYTDAGGPTELIYVIDDN